MKILVIVYRDMQRYLASRKYFQPTHIYVVWEFSYKMMPLFLWNYVWGKSVIRFPTQNTSKTVT